MRSDHRRGWTYNKGRDFACGDVEGEAIQNLRVRSSRVAEVDTLNVNDARNTGGCVSRIIERIDARLSVDEREELRGGGGGTAERGNVWSDAIDRRGSDHDGEKNTIKCEQRKLFSDAVSRLT